MKNTYFTNPWLKTGQFILVILLAFTLSSCQSWKDARPGAVKATQQSVDAKALEAAKKLTNDGQSTAIDILTINAVLNKLPDAYMLYNETKELAVYAAPTDEFINGVPIWRYVFIDTAHVAIKDFTQTIENLGGDPNELTTVKLLNIFLKGAGFQQVSTEAAVVAALVQSTRLAIGFLHSIAERAGSIEIIVMPAYLISPDVNPFVQEWGPQN